MDEEQLCSKELFGEFAIYLYMGTKNRNNGVEQLMCGTALTTFSRVKTMVQKQFPNNLIFKETDWVTSCLKDIEKKISRQNIADEQPISDKVRPLGRVSLVKMGRHVYGTNSVSNVVLFEQCMMMQKSSTLFFL